MLRYTNLVQDNAGNALGGVTVAVYNTGTAVLATLYNQNGSDAKSNPFTNDSDGTFEFYIGNGRYDIVYTKSGYTFTAANTTDIAIYDPLESGQTLTGPIISSGTVVSTGSTTSRTLATRFAEQVNVRDFGAVGDGTTSDQTAVAAAIAAAYSSGATVYWPVGTYLTTATLPNFHDVEHRGPGIHKRGSTLFYVDPSLNSGVTNNLYIATTGDNANDGLGSSQPRLTLQSMGNVIYKYTYGNVTWTINIAAGTYLTTGTSFSAPFPTPNRVRFVGPSVSAGVQPTAAFQGTGGINEVGLYFQNLIRAEVRDLKFTRFRTGASPSANALSAGVIGDSRCELYTRNVWTDDCDQGIYLSNGSQARIEAGRHGYTSAVGAGVQFIRHSHGTVGYNGSAADVTGATGVAFNQVSYGVFIQEFSMAHADYCYFDTPTLAGIFINTGRVHTVASTFDTCPVGIDGRFNANIGVTTPTFTSCTTNVACRSGSKLAGADSVDNDSLYFTEPIRENDAVVSSNATATPVEAYTKTFLAAELHQRGSGFDVEVVHTVTNTNDTKTVTVVLGGVTLLTATIAAATLYTVISVKMRVITATNSLHVWSEVRQNGVAPIVAWTNVTTVDLVSGNRTLTVNHYVTSTSDTSHIRNVDVYTHR